MADLAGYLPTVDAWAYLKPYYTRRWLEIASAEVPDHHMLDEPTSDGQITARTAYVLAQVRARFPNTSRAC